MLIMKKNKKTLIISVLTIALIVAVGINATLAYFTDKDTVTNTFTMGDIKINITEPGWSEEDGRGLLPGNVREKDPTVTALKGQSYMRVRMEVTDGDGSLITDTGRLNLILAALFYDTAYGSAGLNLKAGEKYSAAELQALVTAGKINRVFNASAFAFAGIETGKPAVRYYNYIANGGIFDAAKDPADRAVLFSNVVIPKDWHNEEMYILSGDTYAVTANGGLEVIEKGNGFKIILTAEAVQSSEMMNAAEAFAVLDDMTGVTRDTSGV